MLVEVPIKETQPVCRKAPPRNLGKIFFIFKERKKMINDVVRMPRKPLARELGMIGLGMFLIIAFFAVTADIFAPYPWEYDGMLVDSGPTPHGPATIIQNEFDTALFSYLSPPDAPQIASTGFDAPDSNHFAYETDLYVEPDFNHAHPIYALCPFNLSPVGSFEPSLVDFSVTLSINGEESTGFLDGGFMVQVVVDTDVVANWTGLDYDPVNLASYLILGPNNNIRLNIMDISPDPIKIVVDWSPITWQEGQVQRSLAVNDSLFLARFKEGGSSVQGWKYLDATTVKTLSDIAELQYGVPPFTLGRSGGFHTLGTDQFGHDTLTGLIYGAREALIVSFIAMAISAAIGLALGSLLGILGIGSLEFFRNIPQPLILGLRIIFMLFIRLTLLIFIFSFLQSMIQFSGAWGALLFLAVGFGITGWAGITRVVRDHVLSSKEYVNSRETTIKALSAIAFGMAEVIFLDTYIYYLGLGHPITPAWGRMLQLAQAGFRYAWWPWLFPVLAIIFTILGLIFLGYGLGAPSVLLREKELDYLPSLY
ncbi:MAG: ABC transporter permease [Promethearchaeota archaeon]